MENGISSIQFKSGNLGNFIKMIIWPNKKYVLSEITARNLSSIN